jgi:hypothetical protein
LDAFLTSVALAPFYTQDTRTFLGRNYSDDTVLFSSVRNGAPAFVFDMIKPERPKVDPGRAIVPEAGGVASGRFHDPRGWSREAQSGADEAGGVFGGGL